MTSRYDLGFARPIPSFGFVEPYAVDTLLRGCDETRRVVRLEAVRHNVGERNIALAARAVVVDADDLLKLGVRDARRLRAGRQRLVRA